MKIAVVMDSFKGSISSLEAGYAVKKGILKADPDAQVEVLPIADGGEGTMEALVLAKQGSCRTLPGKRAAGRNDKLSVWADRWSDSSD